jgi:hypothetical protein
VLFLVHGVLVDQHLKGDPVNLFGAEKLSLLLCFAVAAWASWARLRHAVRRRAQGPVEKVEAHWDTPVPAEWAEG